MTRTLLPALSALTLAVLLPGAAAAQQPDSLLRIAPAAALPLAAPTGAADVAILVHWIDTDVTEMYGFAFRSTRPRRATHLQFAMGQPRSAIGGNWIAGFSGDHAWTLVARGGTRLGAGTGGQLLFDRRENDINVRVPLFVRAEQRIALGDDAHVTPLAAAGVAGGATRFDEWGGYGGAFGEAGVRVDVAGFWLQGAIGFDGGVIGDIETSGDARFTIRFGYIRPAPDR